MDDADHWLRLAAVPGLHYQHVAPYLQPHSAAGLTQSKPPQQHLSQRHLPVLSLPLLARLPLTQAQREHLRQADRRLQVAKQWLAQTGDHWFIPYPDPRYPALLRQIPDAPLGLFGMGDPACLQEPMLAIVGSRRPTATGREIAYDFAKAAAGVGLVISSGLALGIDGAAHQGALAGQGKTVAVLGHGLQFLYPPRHQALAAQIRAQGGALLSEFWPDQSVRPEFFPIRNRIVVGMSLGTLVVEAAQQSGSLISARLAMEYNREVFAIPGSIRNPQAAGCHQLLQQGAKLTTSLADILVELAPQLLADPAFTVRQKNSCDRALSDHPLLANVGDEATAIDLIAERAAMPVADVAIALQQLELDGAVSVVSGGYIRVRRA